MLDNIKSLIQALPDGEYNSLKNWITMEENPRRQQRLAVERGRAETVKDLRAAGIITPPPSITVEELGQLYSINDVPAWQDPAGMMFNAYLKDEVVAYNGRAWESQLETLNAETPGVASDWVWRDVTDLLLTPIPDSAPATTPTDTTTPPADGEGVGEGVGA